MSSTGLQVFLGKNHRQVALEDALREKLVANKSMEAWGFQMTVEKPKQLLRPFTTGANSAMNQSEFLAVTCNSLKAREKSCAHGAIGFGFASHWLKNWRKPLKPITERSNRNHVITFDSHLKTALTKLTFQAFALR